MLKKKKKENTDTSENLDAVMDDSLLDEQELGQEQKTP
jgi:hypothetical protein